MYNLTQPVKYRPLKNGQQPGLNDEWKLNEAQKYCRMLPWERSVILLTCIQVIISLENQVLVFLSVLLYLIRFFGTKMQQIVRPWKGF